MAELYEAHMWVKCSAAALAADPDTPREPESELAREGRAARWAIDCLLYGDTIVTQEELTGRNDVTPQLAAFAAAYVDVARNWCPQKDTAIIPLELAPRRAPDVIARVIAFEIGWNIKEPGEDPRHLLAGVTAFPGEDVAFTIFQPRPFHPEGKWRHITKTAGELDAWSRWFAGRQAAALEPEPVHTPGEQCGRCRRRGRCHALSRAVYADRETLQTRVPGRRLTEWELTAELDFLTAAAAAVEARKSAVEAEAEARLRDGGFVPWYHIGPSAGARRVWKAGADAIRLLTGFEPVRQVIKSPAELEKEGAPKDVVKMISKPGETANKLQRLTPKAVAKMFRR